MEMRYLLVIIVLVLGVVGYFYEFYGEIGLGPEGMEGGEAEGGSEGGLVCITEEYCRGEIYCHCLTSTEESEEKSLKIYKGECSAKKIKQGCSTVDPPDGASGDPRADKKVLRGWLNLILKTRFQEMMDKGQIVCSGPIVGPQALSASDGERCVKGRICCEGLSIVPR